jgi:hypothetical protein
MANGSDLDSFGLAVARATRPKVIEELLERKGRNVSYGSFISENKFKSFNAQLSTRTVLNGTVNLDTRAVIVGANWSRDAAGRGPRVDLHWTPVGSIVGAALHANFAEALLDTRAFSSAPEWFLRFLEIVLSLCAAITFAVVPSVRGKLISILPVLALLFFFQWLVLHGFGLFIDVFVPLVGLGLHAIYERLLASRE